MPPPPPVRDGAVDQWNSSQIYYVLWQSKENALKIMGGGHGGHRLQGPVI